MVDFVPIRAFYNNMEANMVMKMLRRHRINCFLQNENILAITSFLMTALGGIKLMVHHAHIDKAWDLIDVAEEEYLKKIPCPICKQHQLKAVTIKKHHKCKLGAVASMILKGVSLEKIKKYRCNSCSYDFKELPSETS